MSKDDQQKRDSHTGRAGLWPPEKRPLVVPKATANLVSYGQLGVVCAALLLGGGTVNLTSPGQNEAS